MAPPTTSPPPAAGADRRGLPAEHRLLLGAVVTGTALPHPAAAAVGVYMLVALARVARGPRADQTTRALSWALGGLSAWFLLRVASPLGFGAHAWLSPARFPVTVWDWVLPFAAFMILARRTYTRAEVTSFQWAVVATVPWHLALAFAQRGLGLKGVWGWQIGPLRLFEVAIHNYGRQRLAAGFHNHVALGMHATFCLLAAISLTLALWRTPSSPRRHALLVAALLGGGGAAALLLASGSRGAWLIAGLVASTLLAVRGLGPRAFLPLLAGALVIGLAMSPAGPLSRRVAHWLPDIVRIRVQQLDAGRGEPVAWRLEVFRCALDLVRERPLTGWGIGGMAPECERRQGRIVNHAHNVFLQLASEVGVPATLLTVAIFSVIFAGTGRRLLAVRASPALPLLAIAVAGVLGSQVSLPIFHVDSLEHVFWWSLAAAYAWSRHPPPSVPPSEVAPVTRSDDRNLIDATDEPVAE